MSLVELVECKVRAERISIKTKIDVDFNLLSSSNSCETLSKFLNISDFYFASSLNRGDDSHLKRLAYKN
jgi:hypothetical protein